VYRKLVLIPVLAALLTVAAAAATRVGDAQAAKGPDLSKVTLRIGQIADNTEPILEFAHQLDTPYKIEWSKFTSGPPLIAALSSGAIDSGFSSSTGIALAQAAGTPLTAVAEVVQPSTLFQLLVPGGSSIHSVAQLKGKKIAVLRGSAGEGFLLAVLKTAHLTESDVQIIDIPPASALTAFGGGNFDAWATWEPTASQAIVNQNATLLTDGGKFYSNFGFFITGSSTLKDPAASAALADFLKRFAKANAYVISNLATWKEQYATVTGLPAPVARVVAPHQLITLRPLDQTAVKQYKQMINLLRYGGLLSQTIKNPTGFFDTRFNALLAAAGK
jgi:sulfonate transport system substrate-binding protein